MRHRACLASLGILLLLSAARAEETANAVHTGPPPAGFTKLPHAHWAFGGEKGTWWIAAKSGEKAHARDRVGVAHVRNGGNWWSSYDYGQDHHNNRLAANTCFAVTYQARGVRALTLQFFNATQQRLMEIRLPRLTPQQPTQLWFNLLHGLRGGEPFPAAPRVGDRITKVIARAEPAGEAASLKLDAFAFLSKDVPDPPPIRVLPAETINRVNIQLTLEQPAAVRPQDVTLARWPKGRRIAATFLYDHPVKPDPTLWEAKALARHGWRGTWMLRALLPEAPKMIRELEKLGMEIGALPAMHWDTNLLSYAACLNESAVNRLALQRIVKGNPIVSFENPDYTNRGGYGPFWVGTHCMRGARDAGFLIQNGWGKYCYLGYIEKPRWGRDVSTAMIQLYRRRPGPSEPMHLLPGMPPHEPYGYEENFSMPLTGAREIYGRISEFTWVASRWSIGQAIPQKYAQMVDYTERFDLGKVIVIKTMGVNRNARAKFEQVLRQFGGRDDFWYTTLGEIGTYEYLRSCSRVVPVGPGGRSTEAALAVEMVDVNPEWVRQDLTVRLPAALKVNKATVDGREVALTRTDGAVLFDVPLNALLRKPLEASVQVAPRLWTLPGEGELALNVRNPSETEITFEVRWLVPPGWGWELDSPAGAERIALKPGHRRTLRYRVRTTTAAGFGIWPATARLKVETPAGIRYQYAGAEVVVAPRVDVRVQPWLPLFIKPGDRIRLRVTLSRSPTRTGIHYSPFDGKPVKRFLFEPQAEAARCTVQIPQAEGFRVTPAKVDLDLPRTGDKPLYFLIENTGKPADPQKPFAFMPQVRLDGAGRIKIAPDPVRVYVDSSAAYEPLDEKGLVLYCSFDGPESTRKPRMVLDWKKAGLRWGPVVLRTPGRGPDGKGAPNFAEGRKGQALVNAGAWFPLEKHLNPLAGSMLFFWRMPPGGSNGRSVDRNRAEYNLISAGGLYAFFRQGRLHLSYRTINEAHKVSAPWPTDEKWHHVAVTWDAVGKAMRLYVDGKLVSEDADAAKEWLVMLPQYVRHLRDFPGWKDYYKAEYFGNPPGGTYRFKVGQVALSGGIKPREKTPSMDELYVFDRALTAEQIGDHMRSLPD